MSSRDWLRRIFRFNAVGAMGFAVQLIALSIFRSGFGWSLAAATGLAVEIAVLHNFVWHERWTWRDRSGQGSPMGRLLRFNLSNGLVSMVVNLALMQWLAGSMGMPYLAANLVCVAAGAAANYAVADRLVFAAGAEG